MSEQITPSTLRGQFQKHIETVVGGSATPEQMSVMKITFAAGAAAVFAILSSTPPKTDADGRSVTSKLMDEAIDMFREEAGGTPTLN